jgi:hypothetical protein
MKKMFYTYSQNNSGGYFIGEPQLGISEYIIIEATSFKDADERLNKIAETYDDFFDYCGCCGERWTYMDEFEFESDRNEVPSIRGSVYNETVQTWFRDKCHIHHMNGKIEQVDFDKEDPTKNITTTIKEVPVTETEELLMKGLEDLGAMVTFPVSREQIEKFIQPYKE